MPSSVIIIPARGGSKRIAGKNIRNFAGKPMIAYAIQAALDAKVADRVIVSTESEEIARIARQWGAEVPFIRPLELADDQTPTSPVILHAIDELEKNDYSADYICCLYATTPFVQPHQIKCGLQMVTSGTAMSTCTVARFPSSIWRGLRLNNEDCLEAIWPEHRPARSQDLPESYYDAGQFYWAKTANYRQTRSFLGKGCKPIILPRYLAIDLDTLEDWYTAELIFTALGDKE